MADFRDALIPCIVSILLGNLLIIFYLKKMREVKENRLLLKRVRCCIPMEP